MHKEINATRTLIITLNWNGANLTLDCCVSISKILSDSYDVLILDNFSEAADFEKLEEGLKNKFTLNERQNIEPSGLELLNKYKIESVNSYAINQSSNIFLARSTTNHGFARGCNFGALYANNFLYSHVLFLNNDTVVESNFLNHLFNYKKTFDAVIPQIRFFEPNTKIWNCGGSISRFGIRRYFFANQDVNSLDLPNEPIVITFATGCCILMETMFYINVGMFTEDFFFGEEDVDFALRLISLNAKVACIPEAIIYHKVGASLDGDSTKLRRKAFIHYLNRYINMKRHLGAYWIVWLVPASIKMLLNLKKINQLTSLKSFYFCLKVLFFALCKNKVDKEFFEKIMRKGY